MALRISLSSSPSIRSSCSSSPSASLSCSLSPASGSFHWHNKRMASPAGGCWKESGRRAVVVAKSSVEAEAVPSVGQVTEVNKDTFWPLVKGAGEKIVVVDMYTQWCGPCKVMAPKFKALSEKYLDVVFMKLDCNQENKSLAKELGIKVVPTFKILKDSKVVKEVTGAKLDDLVLAIDTVKSS